MRFLLLISLFMGGLFGGPSAPQQAAEKFAAKQYAEAAALFQSAIETYPGQRATLEYNIAHAFFLLDSTNLAMNWWGRAAESKIQEFPSSYSHNNLGVLIANAPATPPMPPSAPPAGASAQGGDPLQQQIDQMGRALESFKSAMRRLPDNDIARYNYELLKRRKKKLEEQQQQQQNQQNQDQDQQQEQQQKEEKDDQQQQRPQSQQRSKSNTEKNGQNGEETAEGEEMGMQEAKMLLEAMKENEKKFLQQLEKSKKHRPNRQDGPDW
jgi:Ca-activated chloride channel homolog